MKMALPSSALSLASRLLSFRPTHGQRMIHSRQGGTSFSKAASQTNYSQQAPPQEDDFSSTESSVIQDIEVDDTLNHKDFFGVKKLFSTELLFRNKVHYGHKATSLDPGMRQFVYGIRSNHVIFDLDITACHLQEALNITAHIALRGGIILFVSRLPHAANIIETTAKKCGEYAHTRMWMGGTLLDINSFQGMDCRLPDLIILPSTLSELGSEHVAIRDAAKLNIPTIAVVDSNCSPNLVTYPIPGNDDTTSTISFYCSLFSKAIALGKAERAQRFALLDKQIAAEETEVQKKLSRKTMK